jgi:hypothetical protein
MSSWDGGDGWIHDGVGELLEAAGCSHRSVGPVQNRH